MVEPRFDPVVHAPNRLQLCAMLSAVDDAEFAVLRDSLGVSDSVLSKHLKVLEDSGYLLLTKRTVASRVRTLAALTAAGRAAYAGHVAELRRLVAADAAAELGAPASSSW
jgi:DNA-binding MarR family transcriptional regulator